MFSLCFASVGHKLFHLVVQHPVVVKILAMWVAAASFSWSHHHLGPNSGQYPAEQRYIMITMFWCWPFFSADFAHFRR